jgi:hypothetical protein
MLAVFQISYQVCRRATADVAGSRDEYRLPWQEALVVAADPRQIATVISANVELKPGEEIEVLQWRQLGRGHAVFMAETSKEFRQGIEMSEVAQQSFRDYRSEKIVKETKESADKNAG